MSILTVIVLVLAGYIIFLQVQFRSINRQIEKRLKNKTRQPLTLELINRDLNRLTANINRCLKAEENLRLDGIREEQRFKELIANLSHDLRTPLTAIKGYQQLIAGKELSDDQRHKLGIAQKHANELGALIEHFFEYSYYINLEPQPRLERINLTNLVTECLAASIEVFEAKELMVHMVEHAPVFAWADKEMATRMIQNLVRNCAMHSAGDVEVRLGSAQHAFILFRNRVKNAAELEPERLFERFYTADRAKGRSTGLGLAIVKLLADQLGGGASASLQDGFLEISVQLQREPEREQSLKKIESVDPE
ncbi:sensor histidine kinase [Paenibacillus albidus]|uniref:sensor histidine kinase n=1 Tax=Paenibacillus albidus TaxID=2041023 RepID=UPI001E5AE489|nr:HAMP domain-containing sensor histidine kinase [Paenibacillus albidus]